MFACTDNRGNHCCLRTPVIDSPADTQLLSKCMRVSTLDRDSGRHNTQAVCAERTGCLQPLGRFISVRTIHWPSSPWQGHTYIGDAANFDRCFGLTVAHERCTGAMVRLTALAGLLVLTLLWPSGADAAPTFKRHVRNQVQFFVAIY
jgi:hypothetical protein